MTFHPAGGGTGTDVPAPPPGPGAVPPFAAPPTDRNKRGLWIGLIVGGLAVVLCCVGGVFGIGLLYVGTIEQAKTQANEAVTAYLNAVLEDDYALAHQQLCSRLAARISPDELEARERREPFTDYTLDEPTVAETVEVLAHLNTSSGEVVRLFQLDTGAGGRLSICGMVSR